MSPNPHLRRIALLALSGAAAALASCSVYLPTHRASNDTMPDGAPLFEWHGDEMQGPTKIDIHLDQQKAYVYRDGQEAGWTTLASGTRRHPTPTGHFSVIEKTVDKVSNTYGVITNEFGEVVNWDAQAGVTPVPRGCRFVGAQMPYWMRLTGYGVGMHAGEIPDPGYPASHGCIRLPRAMAEKLFGIVHEGTPVTISGYAPEPASPPIVASRAPAAPIRVTQR